MVPSRSEQKQSLNFKRKASRQNNDSDRKYTQSQRTTIHISNELYLVHLCACISKLMTCFYDCHLWLVDLRGKKNREARQKSASHKTVVNKLLSSFNLIFSQLLSEIGHSIILLLRTKLSMLFHCSEVKLLTQHELMCRVSSGTSQCPFLVQNLHWGWHDNQMTIVNDFWLTRIPLSVFNFNCFRMLKGQLVKSQVVTIFFHI